MTDIVIEEKKTIKVTPRLLAQAFWGMDNDDQAKFFDELSNIAGDNLSGQMEYVSLFTDNLSMKALAAMVEIGKEASKRMDKMQ